MRMIANYKRLPSTNPELLYRFPDEVRVRFDAHALIRTLMWTNVTGKNANTISLEMRDDVRIDSFNLLYCHRAPGHPGLVGDNKERGMSS